MKYAINYTTVRTRSILLAESEVSVFIINVDCQTDMGFSVNNFFKRIEYFMFWQAFSFWNDVSACPELRTIHLFWQNGFVVCVCVPDCVLDSA